MYLEERRQLEKALYFKAVGIPKQACYWCFFNTGQGKDGSSCCQEKKMDTAVIL